MTLPMRTWMLQTVITATVLAGCGGGISRTCEYRSSHSLSTMPRFSLTVTLPDGSSQSCGSAPDGGAGWPTGELSGWVTEAGGTAFSLDTCAAGTGCSPQVSRFAIDAPDLLLALPLGRQVTARWRFTKGGFVCTQQLVVNDGSPSDATSLGLWLAGTDATDQLSIPVPFSVARQELYCNPSPGPHPCNGGASPPDDYALVFTPASGEPPLSLATGKTETLALTVAPGLSQHLTVRNLRSYQTDRCDDYWNWAWWAAGHAGASGQLE
jgi:hypothetical protein